MKLTCPIVGFVALVAVAACGGDDGGTDGAAGARSGSGGNGGSEAGTDADAMAGGKSLTCGVKKCRIPEDSPFDVCCKDEFTGACGLLVGDNQCQQMRAEVVASCPLPDIPGIADATAGSGAGGGVSGCCTANNECGVDLGVGTGCSSNSSLCTFFPPEYASKLELITCDGKTLETKPAGCLAPEDASSP
jgi:hypothetical protein